MCVFFSVQLLCSFFRLKELFQVKNGLTTSLLVFENAKNVGLSGDAKRRKKEDGLILTGKRDSRRHSTTNFSENVLVAEKKTSYQMLEVLPFCERETA